MATRRASTPDRSQQVKALRKKAQVTQEELAKLLGTSWVTISRWERRVADPGSEMQGRIRRMSQLLDEIGDALPRGEFSNFMQTPQPLLRGHCPTELLQSDYSFEDLLTFVESAKSGDMA